MSDKEKELDKQDKPADTDIKIKFEPSGEKVGPFVVKKTPESIKIENAQTPPADSLDINSNLGSFGSNENLTNEPTDIKPVISTEKISALEKIQEKSDQLSNTDTHAKIDFQKFERKKDVKIKNAFLLKFDNWLRQPKTLLRIWLIAIASIVVIWGCQITYLVLITHILEHGSDYPPDSLYHSVGVASNILSYISVGLPAFPFILLLTTSIIGINGMLSSRNFHYFLWLILAISFVCFLASTICSSYFLDMCYSFNTMPKSS